MRLGVFLAVSSFKESCGFKLTHFQIFRPPRVVSAIFDKLYAFLFLGGGEIFVLSFGFSLCLVGMLMLSETEQDGLWKPISTFSGGSFPVNVLSNYTQRPVILVGFEIHLAKW
jgi:hypothetical protein